MLQRALMAVVAAAALATAAAVMVVALAFAAYALMVTPLGAAGAAGGVAAICAVVFAIVGLIAVSRVGGKSAGRRSPEGDAVGLADRLMDLVRDKPMASAGIAVAAGLMALRNPAVIAVIVRTILEALPKKPKPK
jgi:hypothetical protein